MREMIKLFFAVVLFSVLSGGLLSGLKSATQARIEYQQIKFVKGPAIQEILKGCSNNPLVDRFKIKDGNTERSFFVGIFNGKPDTVAMETTGKGFGGPFGLMVAVNIDNDQIVGVRMTTNSETPGLGARAKTDLSFVGQFKGNPVNDPFKVKADGGKIDALSGATVTSRGVCGAVVSAGETFERLKKEIVEKAKSFKS